MEAAADWVRCSFHHRHHVALLLRSPAPIPGVYGYTDYYCWFSETGALAISLQVTLYYLPLWAFFIANTVLFALTYRKLKEL